MDGFVVAVGFLASLITLGQFATAVMKDITQRRSTREKQPSAVGRVRVYQQQPSPSNYPSSVPYIPPAYPAPSIPHPIPPLRAPTKQRTHMRRVMLKIIVLGVGVASMGLSIYRYAVLQLASSTPTGSTLNAIELILAWTAAILACVALIGMRPRHYIWAVLVVLGSILFPIGAIVYGIFGPTDV